VPTTIDIRDFPGRLVETLEAVAAGTEIILADGSTPRARLVPLGANPRVAGLHPGVITTTPDFDIPLPDDFWTNRQ
jgi:antitoxin (DNA-binding transcriptional repressor) of toxin-antitoxin stability system